MGRPYGPIGAGSRVAPVRWRSTRGGHRPSLRYRPHDEGLPAGGAPGGVHTGTGGEVRVTGDQTAPVEGEAELVDQPVLPVGPTEAEGEQDEVRGECASGARHRVSFRVALDQVQRPHLPVRVAREAERRRHEQPGVRVRRRRGLQIARLLVRRREPVGLRIRRPRPGVLVSLGLRQRIDVQLGHLT